MHTKGPSQSWHAIDLAAFLGFSSAISGVLLAEKYCPPSTKAPGSHQEKNFSHLSDPQRYLHLKMAAVPVVLKLHLKSVLGILESPKDSTLFLTIS